MKVVKKEFKFYGIISQSLCVSLYRQKCNPRCQWYVEACTHEAEMVGTLFSGNHTLTLQPSLNLDGRGHFENC